MKSFEKVKDFTPRMLRNGMIVVLRSGRIGRVRQYVVEGEMLARPAFFFIDNPRLTGYSDKFVPYEFIIHSEDLKENMQYRKDHKPDDRDIMKIYIPHDLDIVDGKLVSGLELVWERDVTQVIEVSLQDIANQFNVSVENLKIKM